ncbi:protein-S-isoprenylcysteine O-methyltransferase [Prorops nasuta]|uniref:protein-S-isoprenylcysteine O-methyltransferase n=1 Tax=Prorops nasuta TaxID=863751 RepID=UPI0034D01A06
MPCSIGNISLSCFLVGATASVLAELIYWLGYEDFLFYFSNILSLHFFQCILIILIIRLIFRDFTYQVGIRATFLGYVFGIGLMVYLFAPTSWQLFGIYGAVLAMFHYSEFLAIAWTNPSAVSINSFMLNHSVAYGVAACSSWIEFLLERHFFSVYKCPSIISYIGLVLCMAGEILRKLAIFTAKHNFNHVVQSEKHKNHRLITYGVYKLCRHPSYVGWFYWSIGTQLILQNPFCFVAYILASWMFFNGRVLIEEITLLNFFGDEYIEYQKRVGTGLPFIKGYTNYL